MSPSLPRVTSTAPIDRSDRVLVEETPAQMLAIRVIAVVALAATVLYLGWRTMATVGDWWVGIPLLILEFHMAIGLALFTFSLWDVRPPARPEIAHDWRIAVLIPTYDEPEEVLLPTVAAAVSLAEATAVYVLDDGNRQWVRDLAERLGAHHLTRTEHDNAKAGNLNAALATLRGHYELVAVLDADHVPTAGFLTNTLGYFEDPGVALVQMPQEFYNSGSFEHAPNRSLFWPTRRKVRYSEQGLFYRIIQPGKNRWNAAFWCGTNAVIRVEALEEVGGVATDSITEDIHTTLRMHRRGWRTVYHNEILAYGLAARNADEYQAQRLRWGTGAMQLLRCEHPLTGPGLTLRQRLAYATTLLGWFDAWRTLGYLVLPIVVLLTGAMPIRVDLLTFVIAFLGVTLLQRIAMSALSRGFAPQGMATVFELIRLPANLGVGLTLLTGGSDRFVVTPKGVGAHQRQRVPLVLSVLTAAHAVALVVFGLVIAGLTPWDYPVRGVAVGTAIFAVVNLALLVTACQRIRSPRFAGERRRGERFRVKTFSRLGAELVEMLDISLTGALFLTTDTLPADGREFRLSHATGDEIHLRVSERSRRQVEPGGTYLVGVEFDEGQEVALVALSRILFAAGSPLVEPGSDAPDEQSTPEEEPVVVSGQQVPITGRL